MTYPVKQLREYALLANIPVIFCLHYTNQHAILGKWLYQWLIDFTRYAEPPAFHPITLRLIKEKLPHWINPTVRRSDYELFLEGVSGSARISAMNQKIEQAISEDKVLFYNKELGDWDLSSF